WLRVVAQGERFLHVPEVLGLYLMSPTGNENSNRGLSAAESEKARLVHWATEWGERPEPGGSFFFPLRASGANLAGAGAPAEPWAAEALARGTALLKRATSGPSGAVSAELASRVKALGGAAGVPQSAVSSEEPPRGASPAGNTSGAAPALVASSAP